MIIMITLCYLVSAISNVELYDLLATASFFIGLTVALLLALSKRPEQRANLLLSLAVIVAVFQINSVGFGLPVLGPLLYF